MTVRGGIMTRHPALLAAEIPRMNRGMTVKYPATC